MVATERTEYKLRFVKGIRGSFGENATLCFCCPSCERKIMIRGVLKCWSRQSKTMEMKMMWQIVPVSIFLSNAAPVRQCASV